MAQAGIPRSGHHACLPRNNLPPLVHSSPRGAQERINLASPIPAHDAAGTTCEYSGQPRGQIIDGVSIRDRPAEVEDRAIPGHWEGDLIAGAENTHIATLVERQSRFTMLVMVPGKDTTSVVTALSPHVRQLPSALRRSLTWDRGPELAQHKRLAVDTNVQVLFRVPTP